MMGKELWCRPAPTGKPPPRYGMEQLEGRTWGRWKWTETPPSGLIIELEDDVVGIDTIGLRDEWPWRKLLVASMPGITLQDITDLEEARSDLVASGLL